MKRSNKNRYQQQQQQQQQQPHWRHQAPPQRQQQQQQRRGMFIQTQATPNPSSLMFLPGQPVLEGGGASKSFTSAREAMASPLAKKLFQIDGVTQVGGGGVCGGWGGGGGVGPAKPRYKSFFCRLSCGAQFFATKRCESKAVLILLTTQVFFGTDFVTVTKSEGYGWAVLKADVFAAITDHYASGEPLMYDATDPEAAEHLVGEDDDEVRCAVCGV